MNFDAILEKLKAELENIGSKPEIAEVNGAKFLKSAVAFTDNPVALPVSINLVEASENTLIAQIYVQITDRLSDGARTELTKLIPPLNFFSLIGTYGIYGGNELFCKYAIALSEVDDAELRAAETFDALTVVYSFLDETIPLLIEFINERMTFEQAVEKQIIEPI